MNMRVMVALTMLLWLLPECSRSQEGLVAGVARVDITPPLEMKASLGGYGERMSEPAEGVHDRIFAKALVLQEGEKRFALVAADILAFPPPFKPELLKKMENQGWTDAQVLLLPSHSHTSIDMTAINPQNTLGIPQIGLFQQGLYDFLLDQLGTAITKAGQEMTPMRAGTLSKPLEGWAANRREGESEKDEVLTVTRIEEANGNPLAALVNWSAHPTFMDAPDRMFSGGWPGHLQRTVEALVGKGVTVLYYNGAQGDQRPLARPDSGDSRWEKAERYGREIGIVVHDLWQRIEPTEIENFSYHLETFDLPKRAWHKDFMQTGGAEYGMRPEIMETLMERLVPIRTSSGFLRLGDLAIVGIPGEMAAGLGREVKRRVAESTGAKNTVIGGLANEWVSYILSPEQYNKGEYEASVSFYGPQLGPTVVEAAVRGASNPGS